MSITNYKHVRFSEVRGSINNYLEDCSSRGIEVYDVTPLIRHDTDVVYVVKRESVPKDMHEYEEMKKKRNDKDEF